MRRRTRLISFLAGLIVLAAAGTAQARVNPHFFGVIHNSYSPVSGSDLSNMRRGRVGGVRWVLFWPAVQPASGVFQWATADAVTGDLASRGIPVLPVVEVSPSWVEPDDGMPPIDSPAARQSWTEFLQALVNRYGPDGSYWTQIYPSQHPSGIPSPPPVRAWQIWNEPNLPKYFTSPTPVDDYAKLVRISHNAIDAVDPAARIVLGGMPGLVPNTVPSWRFLDRLYKKRVKPAFDAVALHPYAH